MSAARAKPGAAAAGTTTWIALLRGVNVGGNKKLAMAELAAMFHDLGFAGARTLLQSGNVVFTSAAGDRDKLAARLERETEKRFGVQTRYLLRTLEEWRKIVAANPYPAEAAADPSHLLVLVLNVSSPPDRAAIAAIRKAVPGDEKMALAGGELFIYYGAALADSKVSAPLLDRRLGGVCTGRNWNTVRKLEALATELAGAGR